MSEQSAQGWWRDTVVTPEDGACQNRTMSVRQGVDCLSSSSRVVEAEAIDDVTRIARVKCDSESDSSWRRRCLRKLFIDSLKLASQVGLQSALGEPRADVHLRSIWAEKLWGMEER